MAPSFRAQSGYCPSTGVYQSLLDVPLPTTFVSLPHFLLFSDPPCPTKSAFVDAGSGAALSYADLRYLTARAATALSAAGLRHGKLALLVSPNSLHFPALALAVLTLGAVLSTANPLLTRTELESQVHDSDPSLIITTVDLAPKLTGLVPGPLFLIEPFLESFEARINREASMPGMAVGPDDPATVMYSSGTTGKSKGVVSTHGNLTAMARLLRHVWRSGNWQQEEEVYGCVVPLSHMFGFSVFVCGAVAAGATTVVLQGRYAVEELLRFVAEHRVRRLPAVPPMVIQMARASHFARRFDLTSLKEVICSGAPIGRDHLERFVRWYPGVTLSQCYGLTETSGPVTLCDGVKGRFHVSIGRLIPTMEAKIIDVRTGKALPPNRHGELCLRGLPVMQGYLKNQEATKLAIDQEGWLHTGDLCYIDMRGLLYIVDRIKELIKYKAYQVAPAELEEVLSNHPDILDVAVTSFPDEEAGEIPMACIVRKAGSMVKEEDIFAFMENKVAPYKKIRKVVFVKFIPKSPSGKILRRHMRAACVHHHKLEISARL